MTKISFSKKFAVKKNTRLPKLTLENEEKARIAIIGDIEAQFVHQLTKVKLDEDTGEMVMETKERRDKTTYEVPATEFVAKYLCEGDYDTVAEKGTDSANCKFCAKAEESGAFERPRRYTLTMVFKYKTKPDSFTLAAGPFQGEVLPWIFSDGKWNVLADINEENEDDGGVLARDLLLGPCKGKNYQNYEIRPGNTLTYRKNKADEEYVKELLNSYEGDVQTLFGKVATPIEADKVIAEVQAAFDAGNNPSGRSTDRLSSSSREATDALFGADDDEVDDDEDGESGDEAVGVRSFDELLDAE